jgi:hypothetical protein
MSLANAKDYYVRAGGAFDNRASSSRTSAPVQNKLPLTTFLKQVSPAEHLALDR